MLKQFHSPATMSTSFLVDVTTDASVESELLDDEIPSWNSSQEGQSKIGKQLSATQQNSLQQLLNEFTDVLRDRPGKTTIMNTQLTQEQPPQYVNHHIEYHMLIERWWKLS